MWEPSKNKGTIFKNLTMLSDRSKIEAKDSQITAVCLKMLLDLGGRWSIWDEP